jgi:ABC-2 type transport system ATP-binding protein
MIKARALRVDYDDVTAVAEIDLDVAAGAVFGLIGPNGAGKTSTIRALAGVLEPTWGEIELMGVDARRHPEEAHRALGYMPDFAPLYDDLKVWEYLDVFALAYRLPRATRRDRIDACLEVTRLGEKRDEFVRGLSRGMRQRLVLAKTLIPEPRILLLDEPASGLDPIGRIELRNILAALAGRGAAVLVSSHILTELSEYCTAVGIMEKGRMVISGTIESVLARLGSRGTLRVRAARAHSALADILAHEPLLSGIEVKDNLVAHGAFAGGGEDAARLLARLVAAGVEVADFHVEEDDIEKIFLKVGARELS